VPAWDKVELTTSARASAGSTSRAGGITYGQHWLNVKFAKSTIRVPFRILTDEEDKLLDKNYKRHQEAGQGSLPEEGLRRRYGSRIPPRGLPSTTAHRPLLAALTCTT
jgi:hypothetical protein